jgi:hypothetical protein
MGARRAVFMVDHDSRKRVAKKFRHFFFFQNIIFLFFPRAALARAEFFFKKLSQKFFKDSTRRRSAINLVRNKLKSTAGKSLSRTRFIAPNLSSSSQQPMRARARSSSQQQRETM